MLYQMSYFRFTVLTKSLELRTKSELHIGSFTLSY
jgi:hypothetical protein